MDGGMIRRELQTTSIRRRDEERGESPALSDPGEGRGGAWSTWPRWWWAPLAVGAFLVVWYVFFARPGDYGHDAFLDLLFIATTSAAGALSFRAAGRGGAERRLWIFLGLGCFANTIGSVIVGVYDVVWRIPLPYPSLADVFFLAVYPLFAIGLAFLIRANLPNVMSVEVVLDSLIVAAASGLMVFDILIEPVLGADLEFLPLLVLLTSLMNAAGTFAVLFLTLVALVVSEPGGSRRWLAVLLLGTGVYSVANVIYSKIALEGGYVLGHLIELGWHAGMLAVAAAALLAGNQGASQRAAAATDEPDPTGNLRTAVIVGGSLTGTWLAAHAALEHAGEPILAAGVALIGLIIAGRLAYSSIQSRQLRERTRERDRLEREAAVAAATEAATAQRAEELRIARDEALQASRLKSEFLATMSHEVRTPMHGVTGMLDLVLETPLNSQQRDFVQTAHESARSLLAVIDDILDFSRMEAGKLNLEPIDFEPTAAVEGAADVVASKAQAKGLSLMTFVSPEIPRVLVGDPGRLRQVLVNLIGNAVKFTDQGTIVVRAELERAGDHDVTVRFQVTDTGIGLSDAARGRLFQPFIQADASTTRRYGGTGLGLAISKRLTELMGGEIGVESAEGHGSTFWFTARFDRSPVPALSASPRTEHALQGLRVLVVDDNSTVRDIVHRYILSWGLRNGHAGTVAEALAIVRAAAAAGDPYDIAVVDLAEPRWDEFALASAVQGDPALSSTRLILLTELDQRERGERALRAGFAAYLSKPVRQSRLFDAIVEAIAARAPVAEAREAAPARAPETGQPAPAAGESGRILLAEDNPVNQRVARLQLERMGYEVHTVANGREAVEALAAGDDYTLVLMDVQMPEMDGLAATEAIRAAEARNGRRVPIIAMTANAMEGDRNACLAAGMDDYVSKPVNRDRLHQVLARWMPKQPVEHPVVDH